MTTYPSGEPTPTQSKAQPGPEPAPGALLNDAQIQWLRRAVAIMTTMLIVGVIALIGRVIYLARSGGTQAPSATVGNAAPIALKPEIRLALPAGAEIRSVSATGSHLAVAHSAPGGSDMITILDLASGQVVSRVTVERGK